MPNGVRNSIWAVFFLAGMAFMAALIFMLRPNLFSNHAVTERPGSSLVVGSAERDQAQIEAEEAAAIDIATTVPHPARLAHVEKEQVKVEPAPAVMEKQPDAVEQPVA